MRRYPFLLPLAGLSSGVTAAHFRYTFDFRLVIAVCFVLLTSELLLRRRLPLVAAVTLLCALWGNAHVTSLLVPVTAVTPLDHLMDGQEHLLEGVVSERPERSEDGGVVLLRLTEADGKPCPAMTVQMRVQEGALRFCTGDVIRVPAKLTRPRLLGLPGEYDVVTRLALRKIYHLASVASPADIITVPPSMKRQTLQARLDLLSMRLGDFIAAAVPSEEGGVLRAMLLGERRFVSPAKEELYAAAGVNHVLSISGFHIALLAWGATFLLRSLVVRCRRLLLRCNPDKLALLLSLPLVLFYLMLSGAAPATVRSVLMLLFGLALLLVEREIDSIHLLSASAFLMAVVRPELLLDLSFQLSFAALWGLVVLVPRLMAPFDGMKNRRIRNALMFLAASIAATAATAVPVAFYFGRFSVAGILTNFAIVPLLGYGAVLLGFSALSVSGLFPAAATALLAAAGWCVSGADRVVAWGARIPVIEASTVTLGHVALFIAAMIVLTFLRGWKGMAVALAAAAIGCVAPASAPQGGLTLHFLSVGQAESILARLPDGRTILVDGGGSLWEGGSDTGKRLLVPALKKLGIRRIDLLILTHPHPDHLKGLLAVARTFPVGQFRQGPENGGKDHLELKNILTAAKVPISPMDASSAPVHLGEVMLTPLAPEPGAKPFDGNDGSLVLRLSWRRFSCLLTGDMGFAEEAVMRHRRKVEPVSLLKVPHHGSRYACSVALVKAASPSAAIVSAGYGNSFHLPADDTVRQFAEGGIPLYRTDMQGTISVTSDGETFTVKPWWGEDRHFY